MTKQLSIIIPTLNGVGRIERCLESLFYQDLPRKEYEIIVVDDQSDDKTVEVCRNLGVDHVMVSGMHDIEWSKAIGIKQSIGRFLLFIDDDNRLPSNSWVSNAIRIMSLNADIGGIESAYFSYRRTDPVANRYCSLMGTNDPLVYYLKRTDRLTYFQDYWTKDATENYQLHDYMKLRFEEKNLPTLGSQGFMTRRSLLTNFEFDSRFLHMDFCASVLKSESPYFALTMDSVDHDHCLTLSQFVKKCRRNGTIFLADGDSRRYSYQLTTFKKIKLALICLTLVIPLKDSFRGYVRKKDIAWFLHPVLAFWVFLVYVKLYVFNFLKFKSNS
jgi:glycosyltransferase involved in cell wall biosynthesis